MALTLNTQPSQHFNIFDDYYWNVVSDLAEVVNFKYRIEYQEYQGLTASTIDVITRYPEPTPVGATHGPLNLNLRKYLSTKINSDYFPTIVGNSDGLNDPLFEQKFRLLFKEQYAYQWPWGVFGATGNTISNGISTNSTKYYGLYDMKLTYTYGTGSAVPLFQPGSVIEMIDNAPVGSTAYTSLNGIYTVLESGPTYLVINNTVVSGASYSTGSANWSDRRQVIGATSGLTSSDFYAVNACTGPSSGLHTSLKSGMTLREGDILMMPSLGSKQVKVSGATATYFDNTGSTGQDKTLKFTVPAGVNETQLKIQTWDNAGATTSNYSFLIEPQKSCPYTQCTLNFLDRSGAFTPFHFDMKNVRSLEVTNSNWKGLDTNGRSIKYQIDTQVGEKILLNTDWITQAQSDLFEELLQSSYIWLSYEGSSTWQKVLILDKAFTVKREKNDKIFQYALNIELAKEKFVIQ